MAYDLAITIFCSCRAIYLVIENPNKESNIFIKSVLYYIVALILNIIPKVIV